jgi:histidinol phosphatase-like PHP family hydrolase
MFKTETHLHTAEVSRRGKKRAFQLVRAYKEAGYSTVFVTDHFQVNTLDALGDISWEEKVTIFLSGYYAAKYEGDRIGVCVLPGAEICFGGEDPNHYLVYGLSKELLLRYENLHTCGIEGLREITKAHGLLLVQAHPHRDGHCFPRPEFVDGFEVYNSNPRHEDMSEKSEAAAKEHGLFMIGGSDAHRDEDIGGSGVFSEEKIESAEQLIRLLKEGKCEVIR